MKGKVLSDSEFSFAEIIWENEPLPSRELVKLAGEKFGWKKSTTYTVLKHLCQYGYVQNQNTIVSSVVSREEYLGQQSSEFVNANFGGSLSKFLTAFAGSRKLSREQVEEIRAMIEQYEE